MQNFQIKSRWNNSKVIYHAEAESFAALVCAAIKASANLRSADLSGANLRSAYLSGAYLSGANLSGANLRSADLRSADLSGADLSGADLYGANLRSANLRSANLSGANLRSAYLSGADLSGANLSGADLSGANLRSADLRSANLRSAKNIPALTSAQTSIVPEHGAFVGWKICKNSILVQVQIPAKARRSNATGRKCRAEYVKVLQVIDAKEGISQHDSSVKYVKGKTVKCDIWNEDRWTECGGGIHFFLTRVEAENY